MTPLRGWHIAFPSTEHAPPPSLDATIAQAIGVTSGGGSGRLEWQPAVAVEGVRMVTGQRMSHLSPLSQDHAQAPAQALAPHAKSIWLPA